MSSPIEKPDAERAVHAPRASGVPSRGTASGRVTSRSARAALFGIGSRFAKRAAPLVVALLGGLTITNCSGKELLLATIEADAAAPFDGGDDGGACTPTPFNVKDMGVDFYILFDHSDAWDEPDSWADPSPKTTTLTWLSDFFDDPNFAGMGVGLGVYPVLSAPLQPCTDQCGPSPSCGCIFRCGCSRSTQTDTFGSCTCLDGPTSCDEELYRPMIDIGRLGQRKRELHNAVVETSARPFAGMPGLRPAIQGALNYRADWELQPANEGRRITQIIVASSPSDADCDWRNADSERLLAGAGKPKTYIVGVNIHDDDEDDIDALAAAGGTEKATFVTIRRPPINVPNPFVEIAEKARNLEGRCEYLVPDEVTDLQKVNLAASGAGGGIIPRVRDRAACQPLGQGWFFDPSEPRRIVACENTCKTTLRTSQTSSAVIQSGCRTINAPPSR